MIFEQIGIGSHPPRGEQRGVIRIASFGFLFLSVIISLFVALLIPVMLKTWYLAVLANTFVIFSAFSFFCRERFTGTQKIIHHIGNLENENHQLRLQLKEEKED